jgi:hypothetical protein
LKLAPWSRVGTGYATRAALHLALGVLTLARLLAGWRRAAYGHAFPHSPIGTALTCLSIFQIQRTPLVNRTTAGPQAAPTWQPAPPRPKPQRQHFAFAPDQSSRGNHVREGSDGSVEVENMLQPTPNRQAPRPNAPGPARWSSAPSVPFNFNMNRTAQQGACRQYPSSSL